MDYIKDVFGGFFEKLIGVFTNLPQNFSEILKNPMTILTILGCIVILIVLLRLRKINITSQMIARIGIALALSCILGMIRLYKFPQGGSITPGRFVPIMLIAFMYGSEVGMFTGFIMGILDFIMDPFIVSPIQVLFDYPLAFMMLGLSGFFPNKRAIGVIVGTLGRMVCSIISGVAFFAEYAGDMPPLLYSLSVNVPVIGIEGAICLVLIIILPINEIINQVNKNVFIKQEIK